MAFADGGAASLPDALQGIQTASNEWLALSQKDRAAVEAANQADYAREVAQNKAMLEAHRQKLAARKAAQPTFARGDADRAVYQAEQQAARLANRNARRTEQAAYMATQQPQIDAARAAREAAAQRNLTMQNQLNPAAISGTLAHTMRTQGPAPSAVQGALSQLQQAQSRGARDIQGRADLSQIMGLVGQYATPAQLNATLQQTKRPGQFFTPAAYNSGIGAANQNLQKQLNTYQTGLQQIAAKYRLPNPMTGRTY